VKAARALALVALASAAAVAHGAQRDPKRGEEIYSRCLACHALAYDRTGPRHCGLFGRRAGSVPGFATPYQYVFSAYFDSPADVERCMADPRMGQVLGDVPNYFKGETDVMVGETV